jgi:hypothetical protein
MRLLKTNVLLRLLNSYLVDSPQPTNISYLWNFGSLLAICLIIQILTGAFLAMHYTPYVDFSFNNFDLLMRDVNNFCLALCSLNFKQKLSFNKFSIYSYIHNSAILNSDPKKPVTNFVKPTDSGNPRSLNLEALERLERKRLSYLQLIKKKNKYE